MGFLKKFTKQEISWMMYDWANSAHSVIVVTILPIFFDTVAGYTADSVSSMSTWGFATSLAMAIVALSAPFLGVFGDIRTLFSNTQDAKMRGYGPGRFSFNVKGGRCEACEGGGIRTIEMHFLPDIYVPCDVCKGKRYNRETLEVKYKDKTISDVLDMTVEEACVFFANIPKIARKLQTLQEVGLGYIQLGQAATTLSGGEAQRVKLANELARRDTGQTVYILDEPTTGLHVADVHRLVKVLDKLVDAGNTVIVIEHNLDVIKRADYIIDLGPEGGSGGGRIVAHTAELQRLIVHGGVGRDFRVLGHIKNEITIFAHSDTPLSLWGSMS